jgi:hypothetical protein
MAQAALTGNWEKLPTTVASIFSAPDRYRYSIISQVTGSSG